MKSLAALVQLDSVADFSGSQNYFPFFVFSYVNIFLAYINISCIYYLVLERLFEGSELLRLQGTTSKRS